MFGAFLIEDGLNASLACAATGAAKKYRFELVHRTAALPDGLFNFAPGHSHANTDQIVVAHRSHIGYKENSMKYVWILALLGCGVLFWQWRNYAYRSLLRWLSARREWNDPLWARVEAQLLELARRQRVATPEFSILPEFSPNALVLVRPGGKRHFLLSEGLVRVLSNGELEAVLALCLAQSGQRTRSVQTNCALLLFPLARFVYKLPQSLQTLIYPWFTFLQRLLAGPAVCTYSDRLAAEWVGPHRVAAALQRLSVLARKLPPQRWNIALDPLFLISPTILDGGPFWLFPSQPSVEKRRDLVLALSCESSVSLT